MSTVSSSATNAATSAPRWSVVLYDFKGDPEQHTITVFKNDVVKIKQVTEEQWWLAEAGGNAGYIPRSYVVLKPPEWAPHQKRPNRASNLSSAASSSAADAQPISSTFEDTYGQEDADLEDEDDDDSEQQLQQTPSPSQQSPPPKHWVRAIALYSFDKTHPKHLPMMKKDRIMVVSPEPGKPANPWIEAKLGDDIGIVPTNRVYILGPGEEEPPQWKADRKNKKRDGPAASSVSIAPPQPSSSSLGLMGTAAAASPLDFDVPPSPSEPLPSSSTGMESPPPPSDATRKQPLLNQKSIDENEPTTVDPKTHKLQQRRAILTGNVPMNRLSIFAHVPNKSGANNNNPSPTTASPSTNVGIRGVPAFAALLALHHGIPADSRVDIAQETLFNNNNNKEDTDDASAAAQAAARERDRTRSHAGSVIGFFRKRGQSLVQQQQQQDAGRARDTPASSFNSFATNHSGGSGGGVSAEDVKILERSIRFLLHAESTVLFVEGSTDLTGRGMYVILEGAVDIAVAGEPYGSIGPGQVFGAEALLVENSRRPFTATTCRGMMTTLMVIPIWGHTLLCKQLPWYEDAVRGIVTCRSGVQLSRLALFHKLDAKLLDYLGMRFAFKQLKKGDHFDNDALSLVVLGSVSLSSVFGDGTKRELRRLGPGQFFGEANLANHGGDTTGNSGDASTSKSLIPSSTTSAGGGGIVVATALESTIILCLRKEDLSLYASMEPRIRAEVSRISKFRSADLITLIPFLRDIVPVAKHAILASAFDFVVNREGEEIYAWGRHARCVYLVCDGEVEIQDERGEVARKLKQGAVFGEAALATSSSSSRGGKSGGGVPGAEYRVETAIALGPTVCVAMPKDGFDRFVEYAPDIGHQLRAAVEQAAQLSLSGEASGQNETGTNGSGTGTAVPAKSAYIPTSADELGCAHLIPFEFLKEQEVRSALDTFEDIGKAMAPCLKMLQGFPQYMHPVPFDIGRDPQKLFVVSIVKLDDKMDLIKLPASLAMTVGELVAAVFDKAAHSGALDPATKEYFGLKVAARADYLIDRDVELARYKCVTAALRRGMDHGEIRFALVDLRSNPKHGPGLRTVLKRNESSVSTFAGAAGENALMEAIALYDFDGGPGNISFKAGDRLEVETRLGEPMWPVSLMGSTVSGVAPQNFIKAVAPILGPVMAPSQKKRIGGGLQPAGFNTGISGTSTSSSSDVLPGLPPMSLEEFAKAIADGTQRVEKLMPSWGLHSGGTPNNKPGPSASSINSNSTTTTTTSPAAVVPLPSDSKSKIAPWPLRVRLRGIERLFMLPEIERCMYVQVRLELVFGGQVLETKLSRKIKRNSSLRFEDEWFWFSKFVCDLNYSTRVCFTLLGLDAAKKVTVERDVSTMDTDMNGGGGGGGGDGTPGDSAGGGGGLPRHMESSQTLHSVTNGGTSEITEGTKKTGGGLRGRLFGGASSSGGGSGGGGRKTTAMEKNKAQTSKLLEDHDMSEDQQPRTGETLMLAGAALQLWGADLLLRTGKFALGMWPKTQGERLLYCAENYELDAAKLLIELDRYGEPIRFNMPPAVSLKMKTLADLMGTNNVTPANPRAIQQLQMQEDAAGGGGGGRGSKLEKQGSAKGIAPSKFTPLAGVTNRKVPVSGTNVPSPVSASAANRRKSVSVFAQRHIPAARVKEIEKKEPSKPVLALLARDPLQLYQMADVDKSLIWNERELLVDNPFALSKVMLAVNWFKPEQRDPALKLLEKWATPSPMQALELLDGRFGEYRLREFAVKCLEAFDDEELADFLLQLIQALKYEAHHDNPLARFLLRRALANPREIGMRLFWGLRAEMHVKQFAPRFGLLLKAYLRACDSHFAELAQQHDAQELLKHVARAAQRLKTGNKADRTALAQNSITQINERMPRMFQLAIDPRMRATRFNPGKCRIMSSKKRPLWLELECVDPIEAGGEPMLVMFKLGDDLRQDQMTLQILRVMDQIWLAEGMNLKLTPYQCLATGDEMGMLELVPDSETIAMIETSQGGTMGSLRSQPIRDFLEMHNKGGTIDQAVDNFVRSCAGYCVATYVLGIGDRHNDNIMCCKNGTMLHIDFGHFLGNFKTVAALGGFKRERTPFVFTQGMAYAMGGKESPDYKRFVEMSCKAFNIMRLHADELVTLFRLMVPAGMPELQDDTDISYLTQMLHLGKSDAEAAEIFKAEINNAKGDLYRRVDNFLHTLKHA